jgi:hypothetical protein
MAKNTNVLGGKRGKEICAIATKYGFSLKRCNKHAVWVNDAGATVVTAATPSDRKSMIWAEKMFCRHASLATA